MIKGLRKFQQLPMLRSRDTARAPKCSASKTTPCTCKTYYRSVQGGFDPSKKSGVGVDFDRLQGVVSDAEHFGALALSRERSIGSC